MERLFFTVLNMSFTASVVIPVVILLRLLLKKAPRKFSYFLWGIVLFRLICPVVPQVDFGLIPNVKLFDMMEEAGRETLESTPWKEQMGEPVFVTEGVMEETQEPVTVKAQEVQETKAQEVQQAEATELSQAGMMQNRENGQSLQAVNRTQVFLFKVQKMAAYIWLAGVLLLLAYGIGSYGILMRKYRDIYIKGDTIVISEIVSSPFVAGFGQPVIFLPAGLDKEQQRLIIAHEKIHIMRKDYLIKPMALLVVCIHWFNPLVWLAFCLMEQDMEVSCDEAVLSKNGYEENKLYAKTLLYFAQLPNTTVGCPIAFGENSTKARIKNVVKLKKAKTWVWIISTVVVIAATGILLVNSNKYERQESVVAVQTEPLVPQQENVNTYAEDAENEQAEDMEEHTETDTKEQVEAEPANNKQMEAKSEVIEQVEAEIALMEAEIALMEAEIKKKEQVEVEIEKLEEEKKKAENETISYQYEDDTYLCILRNEEGIYHEFGIFYQNPVPGAEVVNGFGIRIHPVTGEERIHSGVDFAAEKGTEILAAAEGTVYETGFDKNAGNYVILLHGNGEMTYYANCDTILVEAGKKVKAGEQIATVGSTGSSTGAHLHFALSYRGSYTEPVINENK